MRRQAIISLSALSRRWCSFFLLATHIWRQQGWFQFDRSFLIEPILAPDPSAGFPMRRLLQPPQWFWRLYSCDGYQGEMCASKPKGLFPWGVFDSCRWFHESSHWFVQPRRHCPTFLPAQWRQICVAKRKNEHQRLESAESEIIACRRIAMSCQLLA